MLPFAACIGQCWVYDLTTWATGISFRGHPPSRCILFYGRTLLLYPKKIPKELLIMEHNFNQTILEELNDKRFTILIPAFIFVVVFMVIGLLGNGIVIYIYGLRLRNSSIHVLLLLLACFDMICCVVGLPLQIVEIRLNFIYPSRHLCKLSSFITFYCCNASILTLLAICVFRYYKVCQFSKKQISVTQARLTAIIISLVSLPLTIPAALFFDIRATVLSPGLIIRSCLWQGSYDKLWHYFIVMLVFNLMILLVMFVLYGLIWLKARKQDQLKRNARDPFRIIQRKPRTKNRIFVGITALFAIGFLPGLLLGVLVPLYQKTHLSNGQEAIRNVAYRMWILNSTLNPVIYGFFGLRFRREVKNIFKMSLSRTKSDGSASDTPQEQMNKQENL